MPRVLYLQLPVLDFGYEYAGADHPLAGGYLAAYALSRGVAHQPLFLSPALTSFAADPALADAILDQDPDVVAASLCLWNVERTIGILREVKASRPSIRMLAGGPEAVNLARRFPDHPFDWICQGEGEGCFAAVLALLAGDRRAAGARLRSIASRTPRPIDLSSLPSPYLDGLLSPAPDRSIWVETMRGCPFGCFYCYYGKSHRGIRQFPEDWLGQHLSWARDKKASEVYFLDPSFQIAPGLNDRLARIAALNRGRIPLHTEARVEDIPPSLADAFVRAGFTSIETGLQSIHPKVLKAIHRRGDPAAFARGARSLKQRGVKLQVDVILGLPGDTPECFLETIDFLVEHDLARETSVFPLLLLPGTQLRRCARSLGLHHQSRPPYQVISTPSFDTTALRQVLEEAERRLDQDIFPFHLPDLTGPGMREDLLRRVEIDLSREKSVGLPEHRVKMLAQCPVFLFSLPHPVRWEQLRSWSRWQNERLPSLMPFFGLKIVQPFSSSALLSTLGALHDPDSYQARLNALSPDPYLRLSCRPFVLSTGRQGNSVFWREVNKVVPVVRSPAGQS